MSVFQSGLMKQEDDSDLMQIKPKSQEKRFEDRITISSKLRRMQKVTMPALCLVLLAQLLYFILAQLGIWPNFPLFLTISGFATALIGANLAYRIFKSIDAMSELERKNQTNIRHLETLKYQFIANVSHELKTPLTSILGYSETLEGLTEKEFETVKKFVEKIKKNALYLEEMVGDLLEISQFETEKNWIHLDYCHIETLVERIEKNFADKFNSNQQKFQISLQLPDMQAYIDSKRIYQCLSNLLENAYKYAQKNSQVDLKVWSESNDIYFQVSDNGPGINADHLPRIFDRFYRVDQSRSSAIEGTGLGLAIVKHIVLAHEGKIQVSSKPYISTSFTIQLPTLT